MRKIHTYSKNLSEFPPWYIFHNEKWKLCPSSCGARAGACPRGRWHRAFCPCRPRSGVRARKRCSCSDAIPNRGRFRPPSSPMALGSRWGQNALPSGRSLDGRCRVEASTYAVGSEPRRSGRSLEQACVSRLCGLSQKSCAHYKFVHVYVIK